MKRNNEMYGKENPGMLGAISKAIMTPLSTVKYIFKKSSVINGLWLFMAMAAMAVLWLMHPKSSMMKGIM